MSFVSEIEAVFFTCSVKWNRTINEKDRVVHVVFFAEFREKLIRDHVRSCRFKLCVEQIV
jgi:hypothetical protein